MRLLRNMRVYALAASLVASASSAWAAADNDKGGLPQLDTTLFPEQLFWLATAFGLLYLLMSVVALPRVASTQSSRQRIIAGELAAARAAGEAAKTTVAQVEKSLAEARARAQAGIGEMVAKVVEDTAARQSAQERDLQRRLHNAEADIAVTREAALTSIRASASDLAATVVEKILGTRRAAL